MFKWHPKCAQGHPDGTHCHPKLQNGTRLAPQMEKESSRYNVLILFTLCMHSWNELKPTIKANTRVFVDIVMSTATREESGNSRSVNYSFPGLFFDFFRNLGAREV